MTEHASESATPTPDLVEERLEFADGALFLLRPADAAALVDESAFGVDEFLPYWAELWPSGRALADAVPAECGDLRVLELGCGLAVPSLVAARRGAHVVATDWSADACALVRTNARRLGVACEAVQADWRQPRAILARGPFDLVLAADVLYEARNVEPVRALIEAIGALTLLADPGRRHAAALWAAVAPRFVVEPVSELVRRLVPRTAAPVMPAGA
jgi:predicted nicotinamide N-methyase